MAFCKNCGAQLADGAAFCPSCGTPIQAQANQSQQPQQQAQPVVNAQPIQGDYNDIQNNKAMGILAYIGILVLAPLFGAKNSKFARFHTGQGLTLLVFCAAYGITTAILNAIISAIFYSISIFSPVPTVFATIFNLGYIFFTILMVFGIVNAAKGTFNRLPVLGQIDFISKNFEK